MRLAEPATTLTGSSSFVGGSRQIFAICEKYRSFSPDCEISQGHRDTVVTPEAAQGTRS
jgi:hypothetical protein